MKKIYSILAVMAIAAFSNTVLGQANSPGRNTETIPLKIIVVPMTKEKEDIRTVLEADISKRKLVSTVQAGFDKVGVSTKDFVATLKEAQDAKLFNTNTQSDVKSALLEFSGTDIYVDAEYDVKPTSSPRGKVADVILKAYDVATGTLYAVANCTSGEFYDVNADQLIDAATRRPPISYGDKPSNVPCLEEFANTVKTKFADMVQHGRGIKVDFSLDAVAARNFNSKLTVDGKQVSLSDMIDDWLADHAKNGNAHQQGITPSRLIYDDVRIPVYDERGRNFRMSKFGQQITDYLATKGVKSEPYIKNGGLYITIKS